MFLFATIKCADTKHACSIFRQSHPVQHCWTLRRWALPLSQGKKKKAVYFPYRSQVLGKDIWRWIQGTEYIPGTVWCKLVGCKHQTGPGPNGNLFYFHSPALREPRGSERPWRRLTGNDHALSHLLGSWTEVGLKCAQLARPPKAASLATFILYFTIWKIKPRLCKQRSHHPWSCVWLQKSDDLSEDGVLDLREALYIV